jgi:hypothetical protein
MFKYKTYQRVSVTLVLLLLTVCKVSAQIRDTVYVGNADSVYLSNTDTVTLFGNVEHNGTWGTTTGSYVYFLGQLWKNTPTSRFPLMNALANDGGIFCITPPGNSVYSQIIQGGFNHANLNQGPIFPNLIISNPHNVYLDSTDAAVYNTVKMDTGLVYMSANAGGLDNTENSFVLGGGSLKPKVINYNRNKYFVSGVLPENTSYFYIRNIAANDTAVFPIGSRATDFTPAGITSTTGDFMIRVFDGAYEKGGSGAIITDPNFLQKTWHVVTPSVTTASYTPIFQHHVSNETPAFINNRDNTFVTMYNAATNTWDAVTPTVPAYQQVSLFPNIGNDGDSVYIHWRIMSNIINSNQGTYFTKRINSTKLMSVVKTLIGVNPVLTNSTFDVGFQFVVTNGNPNAVSNIDVKDDLSNVFKSPVNYSVKSLTSALGLLTPNSSYDGKTDVDLVKGGTLQSKQSDTILLVVNVDLNGTSDTTFTNAGIVGVIDGKGTFNAIDTSTAAVKLTALDIFIPDGFSPNGDGINDKFVIGHHSYQTVDLAVFNRWGNIVFKEDNYQNTWDGHGVGNFLGKELEQGTYYVMVTVTNQKTGSKENFIKFITIRRSF